MIRPSHQIFNINIENFSLHEAVILVVERMSSDVLLAAAKFKEDHFLYERAYQMEFYKAFSLFVRKEKAISVDVPPPKNKTMITEEEKKKKNIDDDDTQHRGFLDFYYQIKKWAIELLREGTPPRVKEHLDRFEKNGRYRNIPREDYAIVDFRSTPLKNALKIENEHYMLVQFSENFENVEIFKNGKSFKKFNLQK